MITVCLVKETDNKMDIKTKKHAKEMGYCIRRVLLNKYGRVPRTEGITIKGETFYMPELEEPVKSRTAWKKEGRRIREGAEPVGMRCYYSYSNYYGVCTINETESIE